MSETTLGGLVKYTGSRTAARIASRLRDEHGVDIEVEPENYDLYLDRGAEAFNRLSGHDGWQWSASYATNGLSFGSCDAALRVARCKRFSIEREGSEITILIEEVEHV